MRPGDVTSTDYRPALGILSNQHTFIVKPNITCICKDTISNATKRLFSCEKTAKLKMAQTRVIILGTIPKLC